MTALRVALVGNPNCGKTALFNLLTGNRQKVANYAGVTVERKEGRFIAPSGRSIQILDLPGAYSLAASTAMPRRRAASIMFSASTIGRPRRRTSSTKRRCRRRLVASATQIMRSGAASPG